MIAIFLNRLTFVGRFLIVSAKGMAEGFASQGV